MTGLEVGFCGGHAETGGQEFKRKYPEVFKEGLEFMKGYNV